VIDNSAMTVVEYQYDVDGIRVAKIADGAETRFLVDKNRPFGQVLEEYTPDGAIIVSYVYGLDLISQERGGIRSYYHIDALGSTRALTDAVGVITDRYSYIAFGRTIKAMGATENAYLFAGEQRDSILGADYLRARYLDPNLGRFINRDPFAGIIQVPISLHPYVYAGGNPVINTDPSGQFTLTELANVSAIVGLLATTVTFAFTGDVVLSFEVGVIAGVSVFLAGSFFVSGGAAGGATAIGSSFLREAGLLILRSPNAVPKIAAIAVSLSRTPQGRRSLIIAHRIVTQLIERRGHEVPAEVLRVWQQLATLTGSFL
jgi:RHS repeat-associated protein